MLLSLLLLWETNQRLLSRELHKLEHGLFLFYEKPCSACCLRVVQRLEHDFFQLSRKHAPPVVIKSEQQHEHGV